MLDNFATVMKICVVQVYTEIKLRFQYLGSCRFYIYSFIEKTDPDKTLESYNEKQK